MTPLGVRWSAAEPYPRDDGPAASGGSSSTLWNRSRRSVGTESVAGAEDLPLVFRTEEVMKDAPAGLPPAEGMRARFVAESVSGSPGDSSSPSRLRFVALFPRLFRSEKPAVSIELNLRPLASLRSWAGRGTRGAGDGVVSDGFRIRPREGKE